MSVMFECIIWLVVALGMFVYIGAMLLLMKTEINLFRPRNISCSPCNKASGPPKQNTQKEAVMGEWITDRLPTKEESLDRSVWVFFDGTVCLWPYNGISRGTPWQPILRPEPYVKPKRWTMFKHGNTGLGFWTLWLCSQPVYTFYGDLTPEAAQEIEDIYNKVLP